MGQIKVILTLIFWLLLLPRSSTRMNSFQTRLSYAITIIITTTITHTLFRAIASDIACLRSINMPTHHDRCRDKIPTRMTIPCKRAKGLVRALLSLPPHPRPRSPMTHCHQLLTIRRLPPRLILPDYEHTACMTFNYRVYVHSLYTHMHRPRTHGAPD